MISSEVLFADPKSSEPKIDLSQLPPSVTNQIDFTRDIKPIFDASCIRCHGAVKPKSGFRLDNQAAALKGGDNGIDILPGKSAQSPLIHYTARLVEDMEMPPPDKGKPLTAAQVGLLRAWIDQGASWETAALSNYSTVSLTPMFGGTTVSGDSHKFRELFWRREGPYGGLEDFKLTQQPDLDTKLTLSGRVLPQDYNVSLSLDRNEIGFIHAGLDQYRKYYDDTGGFIPPPSALGPFSLNRDLYLDIGRAWVDFGLTLPDWPRMVVGYEYDYTRGEEAITSWGAAGTDGSARNIAPASKSLDEGTHVIKFDFDADFHGVTIEDRFRGEFYKLATFYTNVAARNFVSQKVSEHDSYFEGANTLRLEKQVNEWLFGSAGYLYSKLNADASFTNTAIYFGTPNPGSVPRITLEKESHVVNLNGLVGPLDGMTVSAGAQGEWTTQNGFGAGTLNEIAFTANSPGTLNPVPTTLSANYDEHSAMEYMTARFTKIPFTVLFLDGRWNQESIGQIDSDLQPTVQPPGSFVENVSFSSDSSDIRAGFSTSPWQPVSLTADYRHYANDSRYPNNAPAQPVGGYPDFFRSRQLITDEVETKLVLRPCNWLKATLSYEYLVTDYRDDANPAFIGVPPVTLSPGGEVLTGQYNAQIYSIGLVLTPHPRTYFVGSFSYQPSKTRSAYSGDAATPPYQGDTYTADFSGTYVLSRTTDFSLAWIFSQANYTQNDGAATVPEGIDYQEHSIQAGLTRQFSKNLSGRLVYSFDYYHSPSSDNVTDFRAHSVFALLNFRLP